MNMSVPSTAAATPQQLASQMWQVPQQPIQPDPNVNTLSGGVFPAPVQSVVTAPAVQPVAPVSGFQQPPQQYQQPQYQQPAQPVAPQPQQPQQPAPQPTRAQIDRLVASGRLSANDAAMFQSDAQLLDDLYDLALNSPAVAPQAPPQQIQQAPPQQPAAPQTPQAGPPPEELARTLVALQQAGAMAYENGRYVAKYPDFAGVAERANAERMKAEQSLQELANPGQWLRKNGSEVFQEMVNPLKEEIQRLRQQLQQALPKPHEAWLAQNDGRLRVRDQAGTPIDLTPAGKVYDQVYRANQARGIKDPQMLHDVAAQAAEALFQYVQPVQQAPVPQAPPQQPLTFSQAAAMSQQPLNPGFNMPGTSLTRHQPQQGAIPVTNQNTVDFHGLAAGILNGSIPR